ncbi:hypothetical protein FRX31_007535 [Thalictrum thalictroides]|uniref:RING-type domain-containing protein n=1 Tax=Thalictrum thalictroides TaxID=46969 RepID=A0A7J6X263_THATH|nr:hypothetical protein FRX31_007535 [Thalictrum thalictroides]
MSVKCPICLEEEVTDFITIPGCNHDFCRGCLTTHISINLRGNRLPYCPSVDQNNQTCYNLIAEHIVLENANNLLDEYEFMKIEAAIPPQDRFYCPEPTCTHPIS